MKDIFPEYYQPEGDDFQKLWDECIFVFDANVLLDLYRYSADSRRDLFEVLDNPKLIKRLWLPHQVGFEYQKNRLNVILTQKDLFERVEQTFTKGLDALIEDVLKQASEFNRLNKLRRDPIVDVEGLISPLQETVNEVRTKLIDARDKLQDHQSIDQIREHIDEVFKGKVGPVYSDSEVSRACNTGKVRFENKIPPGYIDYREKTKNVEKPRDEENAYNQFGDLLVWFQILDKAKETKRPVIFVTGDVKEDWFQRIKGRTVGPRPELLKEGLQVAGVRIHIYPLDSFYRNAKQYLEEEVRQETVDEVSALLEGNKQTSQAPVIASNPVRALYSVLDTQLRAFILPAKVAYVAEQNRLSLTFANSHRFHMTQMTKRGPELLKLAKPIFGHDISILIYAEGESVPRDVFFDLVDEEDTDSNISLELGKGNEHPDDLPSDFWDVDAEVQTVKLYKGGDKVTHPKFGVGTVVAVSDEGENGEVTVVFREAGPVKLMLKYAGLSPYK